MNINLTLSGKTVHVHSAVSEPEFGAAKVLSADPWDYVSFWLRHKRNKKAIVYWEQAREFYIASIGLSQISSPLTSYYSFLNATKALLEVKGRNVVELHGVTGTKVNKSGKNTLVNEKVEFSGSGILTELCNFFDQPVTETDKYSLYEIFHNLPFLHRAFTLTYTSARDLFLPIKKPRFMKKNDDSSEAWFAANLDERSDLSQIEKIIPSGFEIDEGMKPELIIRKKKRFSWVVGADERKNSDRLTEYHKHVRLDIVPIFASDNVWYLRKKLPAGSGISKSQLLLMFGAMHRLSELSRYSPDTLAAHFDNRHNWILVEFLRIAPAQFINNIACEITGKEFAKPYATRLP